MGLNNTTNYSSPKQIGALTNWSSVTVGYGHTTAIKTDGTLWSWGFNASGQLGINNVTYYSSPKQIGALTTWSGVSNGPYLSIAVKTNGTLWAWGYNVYGQLGLGNITYYSSPKQIGALTNWSKLPQHQGQYYSTAIKSDGTLWTWGYNTPGVLGLGNRTYYSSPKQVGSLTTWNTVSAGYLSMFALQI